MFFCILCTNSWLIYLHNFGKFCFSWYLSDSLKYSWNILHLCFVGEKNTLFFLFQFFSMSLNASRGLLIHFISSSFYSYPFYLFISSWWISSSLVVSVRILIMITFNSISSEELSFDLQLQMFNYPIEINTML